MSISIKTEVLGLKELEKALKDLGEAAGQKGGPVKTALMAASLPVLREAQGRVPVDEGDLRRAIKRKRIRDPRAYNEIIVIGFPYPEWAQGRHAVLTNKKQGGHGIFVEFGTGLPKKHDPFSGKFMQARPFLRPALENNRDNSTRIFTIKLATGIEKIAKKVGNENARRVASKVHSAANTNRTFGPGF
jgi:HK97 gp10 family phage protein